MAIPNGFKIINLNNIKNYYYISEIGEVYSTYSNKILKPKCDKDGYFSISLCTNNNERKTYYIHQLVKLKELYGKEAHEKIMDALNVKKSGRTVYIRFIYVWRMQHLYRRTNTEDIIL